MAQYSGFIKENVAVKGAKCISIYDVNGNRVGQTPLGSLEIPKGKKLYSFGALSDPHIYDKYIYSESDLENALKFFKAASVDFICICGDLTWDGSEDQMQRYKNIVDTHSGGVPVFAMAGNHEHLYETKSSEYLQSYTGYPLFYSFTHGDDVFIMIGTAGHGTDKAFSRDSLQFLYDTLEVNRNKRCFVFQHIFPPSFGGIAAQNYLKPALEKGIDVFGEKGAAAETLLRHYKNTLFFHGHSHLMFRLQETDESENYSEAQGYRSIHIPSLCVLRDADNVLFDKDKSEGYLVDVYDNGIHLRGRDFITGEFLPIASYWIDTPLTEIEAGTFVDETGTITI